MADVVLADLREPPTVGRYYLVPAIEYPYHGRLDLWPVLGPKHTDAEFFRFTAEHYHVDGRFVSGRQARFLRARCGTFYRSLDALLNATPLSSRGSEIPDGRPQLYRLRCRTAALGWNYSDSDAVKQLRQHFGDPATPIILDDGRRLCPHRKADLTQLPCDADRIVTCPLHGLRVQMPA